jgi:hypothetical protein
VVGDFADAGGDVGGGGGLYRQRLTGADCDDVDESEEVLSDLRVGVPAFYDLYEEPAFGVSEVA